MKVRVRPKISKRPRIGSGACLIFPPGSVCVNQAVAVRNFLTAISSSARSQSSTS